MVDTLSNHQRKAQNTLIAGELKRKIPIDKTIKACPTGVEPRTTKVRKQEG